MFAGLCCAFNRFQDTVNYDNMEISLYVVMDLDFTEKRYAGSEVVHAQLTTLFSFVPEVQSVGVIWDLINNVNHSFI